MTENCDGYAQRQQRPYRRYEAHVEERRRHRQPDSNHIQQQPRLSAWLERVRRSYICFPQWLRIPWTRVALNRNERPPRPILYAIVLALSVPYFLASLDQTILSTLTPRVSNDQDDLFQTSWVTSSYLASLNAFMLFYGKVADIFGPLSILVIALLVFLGGSVLTATSTTMVWLILARALAGLGAAGVISVTQAIAAEVGPWHERGQYMGILGAVFGLGTTIGPLVGGLVADKWTWRISFYLNVPLVCLALTFLMLVLRDSSNMLPFRKKIGRVDFFGALMLVAGLMLLLLGLNWGGRVYPWKSPVVIICLSVGLLLLGVFVFVENKLALEPIIDAQLFIVRNIALSIPTEMCVGAVFLSTIFNLPVYYSFTQNSSASESGVQMIPLACSVVVFSILAGWLIARFSVYRVVTCAGTVAMTLGAGLLCLFDGNISKAAQVPILIVLGSGIGCCIMGLLLTVQVSVRPEDLAVSTALATFSQMMGGIMGLAFGSIVSESTTKCHLDSLMDAMPKYATDILKAQNDANEIWTMDVPQEIQRSIISAYARGLQYNFVLITCLGTVAVILSAFLQGVSQHKAPHTPPLTGRGDSHNSNAGEFSRPGLDLNRLDLDDTRIFW
ncbi:MFS general substrate transporter [Coemansia reversa NRRL 1564]|uniref:MFS general substrate transporter n=1 Tax=Coemansia reversa (strain ATCC 12441 / NRRL 1564) TaxID=763665 RepID=A0A2G5BEI5_COERN|nr:MFS general substrate transporter [Coemansia reversa NRRL 1564]|eukprot:PIA17428.1 MFS general substrate transporter [Coemansia reversa NRRL 1564]